MATALSGLRPRLLPGLRISRPLLRGTAPVHLLKAPGSDKLLEIGVKEHFVIARLDGTRSLQEIGEQYAQHYGVRLGQTHWRQLLHLLHARGLLERASPPDAGAGRCASAPPGAAPSLLSGRIRLVADAPALLERLHRATGFARRPWFLVLLSALVAALLGAIGAELGPLREQSAQLLHEPVALLAVGSLLWVSLALHELAHGLAAQAYGGHTTEIGLRWRLPITYLYCQVEGLQFFARRRQQIATAAAGAFMNLVLLLPCYPVWALLPDHAQARPFLAALLLLGSATALANLVPLPPLDGYKILGHAAGCLQLATDSRRFAALAAKAVRRRDNSALHAYPVRLRLLYGGYALGCAALAAAALAACGLLATHLLPGRYAFAALWSPTVAAAAALVLRAAGRRLRTHRRPSTPRAEEPPAPAHHKREHSEVRRAS
ncbi:metalloprotease [Kitasatospora sp. GAS1066B]|uniref:metalloprotease n=1 Tax=Kitasatospora sp. GAS1066B TaxID=3156271 RepID=UPI003512BDC1